jgi:hypothetical protein
MATPGPEAQIHTDMQRKRRFLSAPWRFGCRAGLWAGLFAACLGSAASAAAVEPEAAERAAAMTYRVSYLGLGIGKINYSIRLDRGRYAAASQVVPGDFLRTISKKAAAGSAYQAQAWGRLEPGEVKPLLYRHVGGRKGRVVEVRTAGGEVVNTATPPFGSMGDPPASPAQKLEGKDALSAMVALAVEPAPDAPCRHTIKVFDGRTRYDLALSPLGWENVHVEGFKGRAAKCVAQYHRISGFEKDGPPLFSRPLIFWLGRLSNGLIVPVKMEGGTSAGGVAFSLARVNAQGAPPPATH